MGRVRRRPASLKSKARVRGLDFVVPGDIETPTGGYIYDREILAGLKTLGWRATVHALDASFPRPTPAALRAARATFAALADRSVVVIDGLALPGLDRVLADEARRLAIVALVHHPVALETGLEPEDARLFAAAEQRALKFAQRVITTSQWTARTLAVDGVPISQLRVVEPGVDRRRTRGSTDPQVAPSPAHAGAAETLKLLCVATLTPRKGHALLLESLNELRDRHWHLTCAGSLLRDAPTVAAIQHQIDRLSAAQAREPARRSRPRGARAAVRARRSVRVAVVPRRLRHGARGSRRARHPRHQHDGGRDPRDSTRERERARAAW